MLRSKQAVGVNRIQVMGLLNQDTKKRVTVFQ